MLSQPFVPSGVGLGLRRALLSPLSSLTTDDVQFLEVAPENWINIGGRYGKAFADYAERFPITLHGLSLSIGSPSPLDWDLLRDIKQFMQQFNITTYTEHLSFCSDHGHLYDLMPIPFTEEAIHYVSDRVRQIQDFLELPMALENVSYYAAPQQEMSELDFVNGVLEQSGCNLLLDVNNIYVNSINHRYNAEQFLQGLNGDKIAYIHIAGHYHEAEDLRVDTHGADVIDPVWRLLDLAYETFGVHPTLLERDFNIPPLAGIMREVNQIKAIQLQHETVAVV